MNPENDIYFASYELYDPRYLDALLDKVNIYRNYCESSGKLSKWQRALQNYYGVSSDGTKSSSVVTRGGDQGQLTMAKVNDYRNLVQHQLILITSQRPAGQAKAINSDPTSLKQSRIGTTLIEYYLSQAGYESKFVNTAERTLVCDESFVALDWNQNAGDPIRNKIDPETGEPTEQMVMSGDLELRVLSPWNVARDPGLGSSDDMKWAIYSFRTNRYDLAAIYPQHADEILSCKASSKLKELIFEGINEDKTDQCQVNVCAHAPTPACPKGRWTMFIADKILIDCELPYPEFNVYRMCQSDSIDSCFGYTNNNDLLAIEEVTDALHSICISNQTAFGGQAIIGPKGADLDHTQLGKGLAYFEVDPAVIDKIRPLQLTKTAPEIFQYIETLNRKKETIAGINSVVRGDPEGALRSNSGSALALIQAQSIQFNSGGQRSYYHLLSRVCTGMIQMLQRYAGTERIVRITGKVQGQYLEEFKYTGEDLSKISAVVFEMTNPISNTIGGNQAMADNLLSKNMIKNPRQYITLARTGSMDAFIEDDETDELALKTEGQWMRDYKPVQPIWTENHEEHIQMHQSLIATPESKQDAKLVNTVTSHIQQHLDMWQMLSLQNPGYLIATKQKVLPPPPPPQGPPGGPGQGDGPMPMQSPPQPTGGPSQNPVKMFSQTPQESAVQGVNQPNMPTNPMTGQKAPQPMGP